MTCPHCGSETPVTAKTIMSICRVCKKAFKVEQNPKEER